MPHRLVIMLCSFFIFNCYFFGKLKHIPNISYPWSDPNNYLVAFNNSFISFNCINRSTTIIRFKTFNSGSCEYSNTFIFSFFSNISWISFITFVSNWINDIACKCNCFFRIERINISCCNIRW